MLIVATLFALLTLTHYLVSPILFQELISPFQHIGFALLFSIFILLFIAHGFIYRSMKVSNNMPDLTERWLCALVFPMLLAIPALIAHGFTTAVIPASFATVVILIFDKPLASFFLLHKHPYYSKLNIESNAPSNDFNTLKYQFWTFILLGPLLFLIAPNLWH
ncbi:hypothetical protein QWZ13_03930 [Reinekea marina]|uniref:hypothetical protein n=1 Tax=Reinekea marina TaxID=1310421 RepID=UPI0025B5601A|nr:hypothetical protein [Reinekea marina]MDN3648051.1 hypothetical protein [Reinekea marina]